MGLKKGEEKFVWRVSYVFVEVIFRLVGGAFEGGAVEGVLALGGIVLRCLGNAYSKLGI